MIAAGKTAVDVASASGCCGAFLFLINQLVCILTLCQKTKGSQFDIVRLYLQIHTSCNKRGLHKVIVVQYIIRKRVKDELRNSFLNHVSSISVELP